MGSRDLLDLPAGLGEERHLRLAMLNGIENRIIRGASIAGQDVQELGTAPSTTQKHVLGAGMELWDGRRFRYGMAGGTLNTDLGAKNSLTQALSYGIIGASAVLGATLITVTVGGSDGAAADGAIAANELVGGYVVCFPHSQDAFTRQITANTAIAAGGGTIVLTLDYGIPVALTITVDHGEAMHSPWYNLQTLTSTTTTVLGMPTWVATVGQYLWFQTRGPIWIAPQGAVSVGNNNRQVVFRHDGSIDEHDYSDAVVAKAQHAGYVIANASGGGQGAAFIYLELE